ncbi:hypothetical protein ACFL6C_01270 [Myxococcota bacterium]
MLRLKRKNREDDYPPQMCAASRCAEPAVVVDATGRLAPGRVPLCEVHWEARCELDEAEMEISNHAA